MACKLILTSQCRRHHLVHTDIRKHGEVGTSSKYMVIVYVWLLWVLGEMSLFSWKSLCWMRASWEAHAIPSWVSMVYYILLQELDIYIDREEVMFEVVVVLAISSGQKRLSGILFLICHSLECFSTHLSLQLYILG